MGLVVCKFCVIVARLRLITVVLESTAYLVFGRHAVELPGE